MRGLEPHAHAVGQIIGGRYVLERVIGRGGMGVVWQARHNALGTAAAVKFLYGASAGNEQTKKRFVTEARVTAQLKTRHAVQVFDFGVTEDGQPFLVMELLDGESIAQRLSREKQLTASTTEGLLAQAARALEKAHGMGIVHRDFKPENVFITHDEEGNEQVKVMDFGVAKLVGQLDGEIELVAPTPSMRRPMSRFTKTGSMLGTPYYMAPEQIVNSANLGPTADVWALGVVAYECLTGCVPFDAADLGELFGNIHARKYAPARSLNPDVPETFERWFEVACAAEATDRFQSALSAAEALSEALGRTSTGAPSSDPSLSRNAGARLGRTTPARNTPPATARAATPPNGGSTLGSPSVDVRAETLPTDSASPSTSTPATPAVAADESAKAGDKPWTKSVAVQSRSNVARAAVMGSAAAIVAAAGAFVWMNGRARAPTDAHAAAPPAQTVTAPIVSASAAPSVVDTGATPPSAAASVAAARPIVSAEPATSARAPQEASTHRSSTRRNAAANTAPAHSASPAASASPSPAPSPPPPASSTPAAKPSSAPAFTLPGLGF